jgi:hypothetical protein
LGLKKSERTGTRTLLSHTAFHFVVATKNIATLLELGMARGGIRRSRNPSADGLTDTLPLAFGVGPSPRVKGKAPGR